MDGAYPRPVHTACPQEGTAVLARHAIAESAEQLCGALEGGGTE